MKNFLNKKYTKWLCLLLAVIMMAGLIPLDNFGVVSALSDEPVGEPETVSAQMEDGADNSEDVVALLETGECNHEHTEDCYQPILTCEKEEHTHIEECYNEDNELICGKEEHTHICTCYELDCGKEEHTHTADCYNEDNELICGKEEHTHSDDCVKMELNCAHVHDVNCGYYIEATPAEEPAEEPTTEEPVTEEPVAEEPVTEEPIVEEPVIEETTTEPIVEEPAAEAPEVEAPVVEPAPEEPTTEQEDEQLPEGAPAPDPIPADGDPGIVPLDGGVPTQGISELKLTWVGSEGGSDIIDYVDTSTSKNDLQVMYRLRLSVTDGVEFPTDSVEIRIPNALLKYREFSFVGAGATTDTFCTTDPALIPIPTTASGQAHATIPFTYSIDTTTGELVLKNTQGKVEPGNTDIIIGFTVNRPGVVDGEAGKVSLQAKVTATGEISATGGNPAVQLGEETHTSGSISFQANHSSKVSVNKTLGGVDNSYSQATDSYPLQGGRLHFWPTEYGTKPADFDSKYWAVYRLDTWLNGNNPGYITLNETPGNGGHVYAFYPRSTSTSENIGVFINSNTANVSLPTTFGTYHFSNIVFNSDGTASITVDPFRSATAVDKVLLSTNGTGAQGLTGNSYVDVIVSYPKKIGDVDNKTLSNSVQAEYNSVDNTETGTATDEVSLNWKDFGFIYYNGHVAVGKKLACAQNEISAYIYEGGIDKLRAGEITQMTGLGYGNGGDFLTYSDYPFRLSAVKKSFSDQYADGNYYDLELGDDLVVIPKTDGTYAALGAGEYYIRSMSSVYANIIDHDVNTGISRTLSNAEAAAMLTVEYTADPTGMTGWTALPGVKVESENAMGPNKATYDKYATVIPVDNAVKIRAVLKDLKPTMEVEFDYCIKIMLRPSGTLYDMLIQNPSLELQSVQNFDYVKLYQGPQGGPKEWNPLNITENNYGGLNSEYDQEKQWLIDLDEANPMHNNHIVQRECDTITLTAMEPLSYADKQTAYVNQDPGTGYASYLNTIRFTEVFSNVTPDDGNTTMTLAELQPIVDIYKNNYGDMVYSDLLPEHMVLDLSKPIKVGDGSGATYNIDPSSLEPEVIENYNGSNRMLVRFHLKTKNGSSLNINKSGTSTILDKKADAIDIQQKIDAGDANNKGDTLIGGFAIAFYTKISAALIFGKSPTNVAAIQFENGNQNIGGNAFYSGNDLASHDDGQEVLVYTDDGTGKSYLYNVRNNGAGAASDILDTLYVTQPYAYAGAAAMNNVIRKEVQGIDQQYWEYVQDARTRTGETYKYRITYVSGAGFARNTVLFDFFENAPTSDTSTWKGTFQSLNVSQFAAKGVVPKVYYSTNATITGVDALVKNNPGRKVFIHGETPDTNYWTEATLVNNEFTAPSGQKVTAIAVDVSQTSTGEYIYKDAAESSLIVTMKAPDEKPVGATYAYNNAVLYTEQKAAEADTYKKPEIPNISVDTAIKLSDGPEGSLANLEVSKTVDNSSEGKPYTLSEDKLFNFDVSLNFHIDARNADADRTLLEKYVYRVHYTIVPSPAHAALDYGDLKNFMDGDFYLGDYPSGATNLGTDAGTSPIINDLSSKPTLYATRTMDDVLTKANGGTALKLKLAHGDKVVFSFYSVEGFKDMENDLKNLTGSVTGDYKSWSLNYSITEGQESNVGVSFKKGFSTDTGAPAAQPYKTASTTDMAPWCSSSMRLTENGYRDSDVEYINVPAKPDALEIPVEKKWIVDGLEAGTQTPEIVIRIEYYNTTSSSWRPIRYAEGSDYVTELTLTSANNYSGSFYIAKIEDVHTLRVVEAVPGGWKPVEFDISVVRGTGDLKKKTTFENEPTTIDIPVTKTWVDGNGTAVTTGLPSSVVFTLYYSKDNGTTWNKYQKTGGVDYTLTLTGAPWTGSFTGVNGAYKYKVVETVPDGWEADPAEKPVTVVYDSTKDNKATVTAVAFENKNTETPPPQGDITIPVKKTWVTDILQEGTTTPDVTVKLLYKPKGETAFKEYIKNGSAYEITLTSPGYTGSFVIPYVDATFQVSETAPTGWVLSSGYTNPKAVTGTGNTKDEVRFQNEPIKIGQIPVAKSWHDSEDNPTTENVPESVDFTLEYSDDNGATWQPYMRGSSPYTEILRATAWSKTFYNLPVIYKYRVRETVPAGWTPEQNPVTVTVSASNTVSTVIITNKPAPPPANIDIPIEKTWTDPTGNTAPTHPSVTFTLQYKDGTNWVNYKNGANDYTITLDGTVDTTETTAWNAKFTGVPADKTYRVVESVLQDWTPTNANIEVTKTGETINKVTFTNASKELNIPVKKIWKEGETTVTTGLPTSVVFELEYSKDGNAPWSKYQRSGANYTLTLTGTTWSGNFENVEACYQYRVLENPVPTGWTPGTNPIPVSINSANVATSVDFINTKDTPTDITIPVEKTWTLTGLDAGLVKPDVTVTLQYKPKAETAFKDYKKTDGTTYTLTLTSTNGYKGSFVIPYVDAEFQVLETVPSGWQVDGSVNPKAVTGTGATRPTVTFVNKPTTISIPVTKAWKDAANNTVTTGLPASVSVTLEYSADGGTTWKKYTKVTNPITLTGTSWSGTFANLEGCYKYKVTESDVNGWTPTTNPIVIAGTTTSAAFTNTQEVIDIPVVKTWVDPTGVTLTEHPAVTFTLNYKVGSNWVPYKKGTENYTITLDGKKDDVETTAWNGKFTGVPAGNEYQVVETVPAGWQVTGGATKTVTVTDGKAVAVAFENTPRKFDIPVKKEWFKADGTTKADLSETPHSITMTLYYSIDKGTTWKPYQKDGKDYVLYLINGSVPAYTGSFVDVEGGMMYKVVETVPDGWAVIKNDQVVSFGEGIIVNTVSFANKKTSAGLRVKKVIDNYQNDLANNLFFISLNATDCNATTQVALKHNETSYDMILKFDEGKISGTVDVSEIVPMEFSKDYKVSIEQPATSHATIDGKTITVHPGDDVTIVVTNHFVHENFFKAWSGVTNVMEAGGA